MGFEEGRVHTRYDVELPVSVSPRGNAAAWPPYSACTRDVSVGGLFLATDVPHAVGTLLDLSLVIPVRGPAASRMGGGVRIDLRGAAIRIAPGGVAVGFSELYQMRHVADLGPTRECTKYVPNVRGGRAPAW